MGKTDAGKEGSSKGMITIDKNLCKSCELCVSICPEGVIRISEEINHRGYHYAERVKEKCKACSLCAIVCPEIAIEVFRGK